jgi:hypothetical protein
MRRHLTAIFACIALLAILIAPEATRAAVYNINIYGGGGLPGSSGNVPFTGPCYCDTTLHYSAFFPAKPGDTVNLGTLDIHTFLSGQTPDLGPNQGNLYVLSGVEALFSFNFNDPYGFTSFSAFNCPSDDQACNEWASNFVSSTVLTYTIPANGNGIQIEWAGEFSYIAPVPEPSTWAMLLIGFAGIGYLARRRDWKALLNADVRNSATKVP